MSSDAFDKTADAGTGGQGPVALAPGTQLGKYRLDRVLGEGGMGVVWAAHDPDLERAVAIKVLRHAQATTQLRQRLLREARAMAKLKHANVLTVYEVGSVGDRDYIAMELVDGQSLDTWLGHATYDEIYDAMIAAGRGLAAAHAAGVVHRDFKPHNVLRSRNGRVLVTDFGLARGLVGEDEAQPFAETRSGDALLDTPMTQTGALIGTPAYMAPEQYLGAPPDPRTDQFAFCVTAWQALTGERPFKGATLDEMRKSVGGGVAHIQTKLPKAVRAVLARGLDPDPAKRYPSLEDLLDELVRAAQRPIQRRRFLFAAFGILMAGVLLFAMVRRNDSRTKTGCDDPDAQFVEAWSPALRGELAKRTNERSATRMSNQLDRYSEQWVDSYAKACRAKPAKQSRQRVACLEGIRDRAAAITTMMREVDAQVLDIFEPRDALPAIASCETSSPLAPPRIPTDQPRRSKLLSLIGRGLALRGVPSPTLPAAVEKLLGDAKALDWEPAAPLVLVSAANQYLRSAQPALARATFARAIESLPTDSELRDVRIEGAAYLGLLETSLTELEQPHAAVPPATEHDPRTGVDIAITKAPLHGELAMRITKATSAANADPLLLGSRSLLAAMAYADAAQWGRYPQGFDEALRLAGEARKLFEDAGDIQRAASTANIEAGIYLRRGDERALDDALFAARRAQDALEAAKLPPNRGLAEVRATVAYARRDWAELQRALRTLGAGELAAGDAPVVKGRVVGDRAAGAKIIAWHGDAVGHARDIVYDPRGLVGETVRAAPDGSFAIHAQPGWAIMAETFDLRSTPQLVGTGPITLALQPTVTLSGQLQGHNWFGVKAFARFDVGDNRWFLTAPVDGEGAFDLRGLPPGARVYGTEGAAGTGMRTIVAPNPKSLTWSYGQAIEVIVRAKRVGDAARVWVVKGAGSPKSASELEALPDVAVSELGPVGSNNTDAGRSIYEAGDVHAVITGNYEGASYTACVSLTADGELSCQPISVEKLVSLEASDGRYAGAVMPILFEL